VVITGGSSGIGAATAEQFAKENAKVVIASNQEQELIQLTNAIKAQGGEISYVLCDVMNPKDLENLIKVTVQRHGRLDIAFNNAGIVTSHKSVVELEAEDWDKIYFVNARGVGLSMKYEIQQMLKNGGGCIINTASQLGVVGLPNTAAYTASKHAVVGMTKAAALEVADKNIRVNAVGPGPTKTPMFASFVERNIKETGRTREAVEKEAVTQIPLNRMADPIEIANVVLFLASKESSFMTGQTVLADGGITSW